MSANTTSDNTKLDRGFSIPILAASILLASGGMFGAFASSGSSDNSQSEASPSVAVEVPEDINYTVPLQSEYGSGMGDFSSVSEVSHGMGIPADK